MFNNISIIFFLIIISSFFSISEISLAASRKIKLKVIADEGNLNALRVIKIQENPGVFFTAIQIGLNAVAILAGIIGDAAFSPPIEIFFSHFLSAELSAKLGNITSFVIVTSLFILIADLIPKRIAMIAPEKIALIIIGPMSFLLFICQPLVWLFNGLANIIFRLFNIPLARNEDITSDDVYAIFEAGALAGVLRKQEHELIENVFELDSRTVPSSMTPRENIIALFLDDTEALVKETITAHPHSKFLVCDKTLEHIVGYVNSKDLLIQVLSNKGLSLNNMQVYPALIIPDTLSLSDALENFKSTGEDFAVIINEYALVVGIITLRDVMTTLMGNLVDQGLEEQIIARDKNSWLIEGGTPIDSVMQALDIEEFPHSNHYETIGGFMMVMLRRIPKRTDSIQFAGYKFEVVDIDNHKIDQLLVTRTVNPEINNEKVSEKSSEN